MVEDVNIVCDIERKGIYIFIIEDFMIGDVFFSIDVFNIDKLFLKFFIFLRDVSDEENKLVFNLFVVKKF